MPACICSALHLYLGQTFVNNCVNDYFAREVTDLRDLLIPTQYGPQLIGGDSSQLGSANISFWAKLKLIKSLRELDADYVIIDLGSNTSFNILDFFLAADSRVVVTTCEPASYLEAYNFIKVGLLRRLNRLFGGESAGLRARRAPGGHGGPPHQLGTRNFSRQFPIGLCPPTKLENFKGISILTLNFEP